MSNEENPTFYFIFSGEYEVSLTVYGMKNSNTIKKKIKINVPHVPFLQSEFRYETKLPSFVGSHFTSALELPNKTILAIRNSRDSQSLVCLDSAGKILWEKKGMNGLLLRNPYNGSLFLVEGSYLREIDKEGNVIREFEDPEERWIGNVVFDSSSIYYGSAKIWREGEQNRIVHYECYYTELADTFIVRNRQLLPGFRIKERKRIDKGSDTLELMLITPPNNFELSFYSVIDAKVLKLDNKNLTSVVSVFAFNSATQLSPNMQIYKTITLATTKISGKKLSDLTTNIYRCKPLGYYLSQGLCPKTQPAVINLNDSVLVFLALEKKGDYISYFQPPIVCIFNTKTMELRRLASLDVSPNSLLKINNTFFAVAGSTSEVLSSIILNQNGDVISKQTPVCRYGEYQYVSITPDKQLLYSGSLSIENEQYVPYLLKTNFSILPQLITEPYTFPENKEESETFATKGEPLLFPNPINGKFSLWFDSFQEPCKIEFYNIMGNSIRTLFESKIAPEKIDYFDISDVPNGLYFIKISLPNSTKYLKIIKAAD